MEIIGRQNDSLRDRLLHREGKYLPTEPRILYGKGEALHTAQILRYEDKTTLLLLTHSIKITGLSIPTHNCTSLSNEGIFDSIETLHDNGKISLEDIYDSLNDTALFRNTVQASKLVKHKQTTAETL